MADLTCLIRDCTSRQIGVRVQFRIPGYRTDLLNGFVCPTHKHIVQSMRPEDYTVTVSLDPVPATEGR